MPPAVAGVVFLSGGQSEKVAVANLDAMNRLAAVRPWPLSFSFGRALQSTTLRAWGGRQSSVESARVVFVAQCRARPPPLMAGSWKTAT